MNRDSIHKLPRKNSRGDRHYHEFKFYRIVVICDSEYFKNSTYRVI